MPCRMNWRGTFSSDWRRPVSRALTTESSSCTGNSAMSARMNHSIEWVHRMTYYPVPRPVALVVGPAPLGGIHRPGLDREWWISRGEMMDVQAVWVDVPRCTSCGACVEVCPVEAITLVDGKARVDEELCTGCGACVDACPEGAIQPVIQGELISAPQRPTPTLFRPSPLAETAGAAVVVAGAGMLTKAASALTRAIGRWLARRSAVTGPSTQTGTAASGDRGGTGRQRRHRRRGR